MRARARDELAASLEDVMRLVQTTDSAKRAHEAGVDLHWPLEDERAHDVPWGEQIRRWFR